MSLSPRYADLARLTAKHRMMDAVIDEVDQRRIRIGSQWLIDYASCNYLGFDLDGEIMAEVIPAIQRWGIHPSWSRLLGSPRIYVDIEDELTELLGAPDTMVLPTITHIHSSIIPVLAKGGTVFLDAQAHKTIYDGAMIARGQGTPVHRFPANDHVELDRLLRSAPAGPRLVLMDGVNSMTGNAPDLAAFSAVAERHGALLYVDDAHGFGVVGERPTLEQPYGLRGNSIVRHLDVSYDNMVLVGGFSKAYSSLLAFLALPTWLKAELKVAAPPYLYSGPSPTASLATVQAGFKVNARRGDALRSDLHRMTRRVLDHVAELGIYTPNQSGFPIVELPLANHEDIDQVGDFLYDNGIYVTLAAYPLVPRSQVGFRVQVTAANTDEEIEVLCSVLTEAAARFAFQKAEQPSLV